MNKLKNFRNYFVLVMLLAATWLLTGCIYPHTTERSDEVRGRVLDAQTRLPIKGARIVFIQHPQHPTYTNAKGYFRMKARRNFHWGVDPAGGDFPNPKIGDKIITHRNYVKANLDGSGDIGDILLQPKP